MSSTISGDADHVYVSDEQGRILSTHSTLAEAEAEQRLRDEDAAWAAAWDAAWAAAGDAARDALRPTTRTLQASAHVLVGRMLDATL